MKTKKQLTTSSHKTESENRTQNMLFHLLAFTGKEKDSETGYCYFGARYYDSDLSGLFLSVDPVCLLCLESGKNFRSQWRFIICYRCIFSK